MRPFWIVQLVVYPEDIFWMGVIAVGILILAWKVKRWNKKN